LYSSKNETTKALMHKVMADYGLPSLSVAITIDGKIAFADAVGYADVNLKKLATKHTQYSVGSVAKSMTSITLGKLLDQGKIDLDADIHQYLPDYPKLPHKVTIKQLASHTAGIVHDSPARDILEFVNVKDHSSPFEILDMFQDAPLLFAPETQYKYSSNGYILLSAAIESAANQNFVEYMRKSVWNELNMTETALDNSTAGSINEASYYKRKITDDEFIPSVKLRDRSFLFGGGGFISTPTDLVKMSNAFYKKGYLSEKTKKLLFTPSILTNGKFTPQKYALGWRIQNRSEITLNGKKLNVAHHGGVTDNAATSYLLLVPEYKAAIAFTTNMVPDKFWQIRTQIGAALMNYLQ
jgi:CubicO group peptidase (beta-lactamase class C family)